MTRKYEKIDTWWCKIKKINPPLFFWVFVLLWSSAGYSAWYFVDAFGQTHSIPDDFSVADIEQVYRRILESNGGAEETPDIQKLGALVREARFQMALMANRDQMARLPRDGQMQLRRELWSEAVRLESDRPAQPMSDLVDELNSAENQIRVSRAKVEKLQTELEEGREGLGGSLVRLSEGQASAARGRKETLEKQIRELQQRILPLRALVEQLRAVPSLVRAVKNAPVPGEQGSRLAIVDQPVCEKEYGRLRKPVPAMAE
jgi:hypothetical protein